MLWHEGYHHGQIKLALKLAGRAIPDREAGPVTWGLWMRKKERSWVSRLLKARLVFADAEPGVMCHPVDISRPGNAGRLFAGPSVRVRFDGRTAMRQRTPPLECLSGC